MITKKDFERVAEILRGSIDKAEKGFVWKCNNPEVLIEDLCNFFKFSNLNFDKQKFRDAVLK